MGIWKKFLNQTSKPEGFLGKQMLRGMNTGHAKISDWGLESLNGLSFSGSIVDIGCGGGRIISKLAEMFPAAQITGVDYSDISVKATKSYNKKLVQEKRVNVVWGDVSDLQFEEKRFDLATAFETVYFWPGLEICFAQVYRVLKENGYFLIVLETDGEDGVSQKYERIIDKMKVYKPKELMDCLKQVGFEITSYRHGDGTSWISILAKK